MLRATKLMMFATRCCKPNFASLLAGASANANGGLYDFKNFHWEPSRLLKSHITLSSQASLKPGSMGYSTSEGNKKQPGANGVGSVDGIINDASTPQGGNQTVLGKVSSTSARATSESMSIGGNAGIVVGNVTQPLVMSTGKEEEKGSKVGLEPRDLGIGPSDVIQGGSIKPPASRQGTTCEPAIENTGKSGAAEPAQGALKTTGAASSGSGPNLQELADKLPSKEQVEKYFFRLLAFVYDITYLTGNWTIRFIDQNILQNNTVKYYWKRMHEKMEEAKKD